MSYKIRKNGFTLIELIVVFAVIAILSSIGIATYSSYKNEETFRTSYLEFVSNLYLMRSKSISQVKPDQCENAKLTLTGYSLVIKTQDPGSYQLQAECKATYNSPQNPQLFDTRIINLPSGIVFGGISTISFPVLVNEYSNTQQVIIRSNNTGGQKTISIDKSGGISVN